MAGGECCQWAAMKLSDLSTCSSMFVVGVCIVVNKYNFVLFGSLVFGNFLLLFSKRMEILIDFGR